MVLLGHILQQEHLVSLSREELEAKVKEMIEQEMIEDAVRSVSKRVSSVTGIDFFNNLVKQLSSALETDHAFVTECLNTPVTRVRTVAFWSEGKLIDNVEYDLVGTPCQEVLQGKPCYYPRIIQKLFPKDTDLADLGAESYIGVSFSDRAGTVLGHIAVLDKKSLSEEARVYRETLLNIFAERTGAEYERLKDSFLPF